MTKKAQGQIYFAAIRLMVEPMNLISRNAGFVVSLKENICFSGFDDDGVVQALDCKLYTSSGPTPTDGEADDDDIMAAFADSG